MPPVRRPRAPMAPKSPYETPICIILVGGEEAKFQLHTGLLERTSFFQKHGPPEPRQKEPTHERPAPTPDRINASGQAADFLFASREPTAESEANGAQAGPPVIDLIEEADYVLTDMFFYSRDAFNIFYRHLNDAPPATPKDSEGCEALFKAYALAQLYDVQELQNEIIGALQAYYNMTTMPVTDLIFVVNRFSPRCGLYQYLLAQVAYEMACDWEKYHEDNKQIKKIFEGGKDSADVIQALFAAAMRHSKPLDSADPAKDKRRWRS